jgi:uncharacterized protein YaiL (DUF2058 family)
MPTKRSRKTSKRSVIQPRKGDRRYARRNKSGQFKKEVNVGRSLAADRRRKAKTKAAKGQRAIVVTPNAVATPLDVSYES